MAWYNTSQADIARGIHILNTSWFCRKLMIMVAANEQDTIIQYYRNHQNMDRVMCDYLSHVHLHNGS